MKTMKIRKDIYTASQFYLKAQSGISIPLTIFFTLIGSAYLFAYSTYIYDKDWQTEYRIAQTKAMYNADSGIALDAYTVLFKKDYIPNSEGDDVANGLVEPDCGEGPKCMGAYEVVRFEDIDDQTYQIIRGCTATGTAKVRKHILGNQVVEVTGKRNMTLGHTSSLSDFQYLTATENAGGAPWVWGLNEDCSSKENRREVNWGSQDYANDGWLGQELTCDVGFKTNGTFVMSQFGAPTFDITLSVVENDDGTYNSPIMNGNSPNIFQGDPELDTVKTTCLPPPGYETMKRVIENSNDHVFLDATQKLKWVPGYFQRDTLIMTDIEFFVVANTETSGFHVKQWWYLLPPYLGEGSVPGLEMPSPNCYNMGDGAVGPGANTCFGVNADCSNFTRVYSCDRYKEQLRNFHSSLGSDDGTESGVFPDSDNCISGNTGFKHFDVPDMYKLYTENDWVSQFEVDDVGPFGPGQEDHLLPEYVQYGGKKTYYYQNPTAIYVKGGPVRVKGTYKGRYTIVTDEYQTYKRHAWGAGYFPPNKEDTLWTDIWITGDLRNNDANGTSLLNAQPDEYCSPDTGSDNRLGLVSGSNIYIANTIENGAKSAQITSCDGNFYSDRVNVVIHAHMIAFNESFATQYSNNTYDNFNVAGGADDDYYSSPPFGDGQGLLKYGGNSATSCNGNSSDGNDGSVDCDNYPGNCFPMPDGSVDDNRGNITVWGGIVQDHRGYVVRNAPGPYNTGNIGYGKSYNFDCNLKCPGGFPPLYPENTTCDESTDETPYKVTSYF